MTATVAGARRTSMRRCFTTRSSRHTCDDSRARWHPMRRRAMPRTEALTAAIGLLVERHTRTSCSPTAARRLGDGEGEPRLVQIAREALDDCYGDNAQTSLAALALRAGVSPFHLVRVFTRVVGLSPHQYLVQTTNSPRHRAPRARSPMFVRRCDDRVRRSEPSDEAIQALSGDHARVVPAVRPCRLVRAHSRGAGAPPRSPALAPSRRWSSIPAARIATTRRPVTSSFTTSSAISARRWRTTASRISSGRRCTS